LFGDDPPVAAERYELRERIGRGGLGVVYRAHDLRLRRDVALKFVRMPRGRIGDDRQLFHEALTLARLSHSYIVPVFDVGRLADEIFISMELVDGVTLEALASAEPRPWQDVVRIFRQIGDALAAAHRASIVHGDIKPSNVMVDREGRVRVLDFGLAREVSGSWTSDEASGKASTHPSGTAGYFAPERHDEPADEHSDQFAFSVAMYRTLFGRLPFGETAEPVTRAQIEALSFDAGRHRRVPRWLVAVVRKGLAFAPEQRFANMTAFVAALDVPTRRTFGLGVAGLLFAFATSSVWALQVDDRCRFDDDPFAGIWDASARAALQNRAPDADALATAEALDAYAERWADTRAISCEALARDAISPVLYDLRGACLNRSRLAIAYAIAQSEHVDFTAWSMLPSAILEVGDLTGCADDEGLLEQRPNDAADMDVVASINAGIDSAYVHLLLGDTDEYLTQLLATERDKADHARAPQATLWLAAHLASALNQRGRHDEAITRAKAALLKSQENPRWRETEGTLLVQLSEAIATKPGSAAQAVFFAEQSIAVFSGSPRTRPFASKGFRALAAAQLAAGDPDAALASVQAARREREPPTVAGLESIAALVSEAALANLAGLALERLHRSGEAEASYRAGLAALERIELRSIVVAHLHNNLGLLLGDAGRVVDARVHLQRAAEIKITLGLADSAALTWMNAGNLESRAGDVEAALRLFETALGATATPRTQARIRYNRAVTLYEAASYDDARADYEYVVAASLQRPADPATAYSARIGVGLCRLATGDTAAARNELLGALAEEPIGAPSYERAELRLGLARAQSRAAHGRADELARESLAIAVADGHDELANEARRWMADNEAERGGG
jgi:tetratricopeptide (TPR) repeat protein/predicted Ser/Thr protein kinase